MRFLAHHKALDDVCESATTKIESKHIFIAYEAYTILRYKMENSGRAWNYARCSRQLTDQTRAAQDIEDPLDDSQRTRLVQF